MILGKTLIAFGVFTTGAGGAAVTNVRSQGLVFTAGASAGRYIVTLDPGGTLIDIAQADLSYNAHAVRGAGGVPLLCSMIRTGANAYEVDVYVEGAAVFALSAIAGDTVTVEFERINPL